MGWLKDAGNKLKDAGGEIAGGVAGGAIGSAAFGPLGGLLGAAAGAKIGGGGGISGPSDPFGSKAAQQQRESAMETIQNLQDTAQSTVEDTKNTQGFTQLQLGSKDPIQAQLERSSLEQFKKQQALVAQQEADIAQRAGLEAAGRGTLADIAGGGAFALSPEEQARIDQLRQSEIDVGSNEINRLLDQRLGELQANLAQRGVRGQAASQLQADVLGEGARSLESRILAANQNAAQQALALPGQRVGIQAGVGQNLANFQDQARQQAIANRQALQDPVLLQQLRDERLKTGKQVTDQTTSGKTSTTGTQSAGGRASAIGTLAGGPSRQQEDVAAVGGLIGTIGKAAGAFF
jgi:hypothetical protein